MKRILIIGGSLGGLFAANLLYRNGYKVDIFERVSEKLDERGAGIATHESMLRTLRGIGIPATAGIGVPVKGRATWDLSGRMIGQRDYPQIMTSWGHVYRLLRDNLPDSVYHTGRTFTHAEQDENSVTACFSDGSREVGEMLIGADGVRSTVRQQYLPDVQLQYAGYVAWRGLVDEKDLSAQTRDELFSYLGFCLPEAEQMVAYPVAGIGNALDVGARRYNFVWYMPVDKQQLAELCTDAQGNVHHQGIPPPLIRREVLDQMREHARKVLAPQFVEVVTKTPQAFFQPILDLESTSMAFGRVGLLGDSAFVARPHCGMGVTKASDDAEELLKQISHRGIVDGLQAYSQARVSFGQKIVQHARHLGAYMQAQLLTEQERKMADQYRTPEAVMRETAVPPEFA